MSESAIIAATTKKKRYYIERCEWRIPRQIWHYELPRSRSLFEHVKSRILLFAIPIVRVILHCNHSLAETDSCGHGLSIYLTQIASMFPRLIELCPSDSPQQRRGYEARLSNTSRSRAEVNDQNWGPRLIVDKGVSGLGSVARVIMRKEREEECCTASFAP